MFMHILDKILLFYCQNIYCNNRKQLLYQIYEMKLLEYEIHVEHMLHCIELQSKNDTRSHWIYTTLARVAYISAYQSPVRTTECLFRQHRIVACVIYCCIAAAVSASFNIPTYDFQFLLTSQIHFICNKHLSNGIMLVICCPISSMTCEISPPRDILYSMKQSASFNAVCSNYAIW